jgi:hypothetical protein
MPQAYRFSDAYATDFPSSFPDDVQPRRFLADRRLDGGHCCGCRRAHSEHLDMTSDGSTPNLNEATESGQAPGFTPENTDQQRTHDDILRVLSDFQSGLHSLKALHAQRQELQLKLLDREKQLAEREAELSQRNAQLQTQQADFEEVSARFAQQARDLEAKRAESEARAATYEQSLADQASKYDTQINELKVQADHAGEAARQLAELQQQHAAVQQQRESLQQEHAAMRETIAKRATELQELADRIAAQSQEAGELRATLGAKEAEAARLRSELDLTLAGLNESKSKMGAADGELDELRTLNSGLKDLVREYEDLWGVERHENASLAQRLQDAHAAHDRYEAELTKLREAAAAGSTTSEESERLRADLTELEAAFETLRSRMKDLVAERDLAQEALETATQTLETAQAAAQAREAELTTRLDELLAQVDALKEKAARHVLPPSRGDAFVQRRKQRLKNYRTALRRQVTKVKRASDALSKRYEQCELVLSQRAELAEVRNRVLEAERRVMGAKARTRAGVVTLCAVLVISVIGAMSWVLAREVAPATFLAESTLKADGRGRELNDAELEEWRRFHTELLTDPRFHEAAAERFGRQGIPTLSTPASVAELVNSSVSTDSTSPDELRLTLKSQGRDRTRRTLEVLTSSLASYANAAQQRRIDGGATLMPDPVKVGSDAIDQTQMYYALGMMGAGVSLSGLLSLALWSKLANAKTSFENDSRASELLDAANWAELTPDKPIAPRRR